MSKTTLLTRLVRDEHGATAVEYGLILAMIVIAMMGALSGVANETNKMWGNVQSASATAIAS
ncbi:MAG: Flp family type IVb pilin [Novosphingobium sp.]